MSSNSPEGTDHNIDVDTEAVQASLLRTETLELRLARPLLQQAVKIEAYPDGLRESGKILEDYKVPKAA